MLLDFFYKSLTSILRFPDEIIYVSAKLAPQAYELSGAVSGANADINVTKGDVLKIELDASGHPDLHPFWIKTVRVTGPNFGVVTGISGVGQGQTSGLLIWDTTDVMEGTYYYQCQYASSMGGRIIVAKGTTSFRTQLLISIHHIIEHKRIYIFTNIVLLL